MNILDRLFLFWRKQGELLEPQETLYLYNQHFRKDPMKFWKKCIDTNNRAILQKFREEVQGFDAELEAARRAK